MPHFIKSHPVVSTLIGLLLIPAALIVQASLREDFVVEWSRTVPSQESTVELGRAIESLPTWPVFHHGLKYANVRDASGKDLTPEESRLLPGQTVRFFVEPRGKEWKRFELLGRVKEYNPHRRLSFEFISESKGKLEKVFDDLEWSLEIDEAPEELRRKGFQSIIRGGASGRTKSWRGRLFGAFSPRILMNQVYTVDLVKLGTLQRQIESKKQNFAPNYQ